MLLGRSRTHILDTRSALDFSRLSHSASLPGKQAPGFATSPVPSRRTSSLKPPTNNISRPSSAAKVPTATSTGGAPVQSAYHVRARWRYPTDRRRWHGWQVRTGQGPQWWLPVQSAVQQRPRHRQQRGVLDSGGRAERYQLDPQHRPGRRVGRPDRRCDTDGSEVRCGQETAAKKRAPKKTGAKKTPAKKAPAAKAAARRPPRPGRRRRGRRRRQRAKRRRNQRPPRQSMWSRMRYRP